MEKIGHSLSHLEKVLTGELWLWDSCACGGLIAEQRCVQCGRESRSQTPEEFVKIMSQRR